MKFFIEMIIIHKIAGTRNFTQQHPKQSKQNKSQFFIEMIIISILQCSVQTKCPVVCQLETFPNQGI
jgi:hypothetical protein